jgi:hypothetical protein
MSGAMAVVAIVGILAQLASIGSAFWLGGRLLRKALRTGNEPERLLGLHLVLAIGVGSLFLGFATLTAYSNQPLPGMLFDAITVAGNTSTILGLMAALWFNYHVFHERRPGGRVVALLSSALMWLGFVMYAAGGGIKSEGLYGPESWAYVGAMVLGDLWVITDALRFRSQLMRRLALGLADPLVVDRLLLWSVASLARVGLVLMAPLVTALVQTQAQRLAMAPFLLLLSALLILAATVSLWLMLAPSARYRSWVNARYAPTSTI